MATSVFARITEAPDDLERPAPRPTPSQIIAETVLACLKAQGLTVVRLADTSYGSDEQDAAFARDVGANSEMALSAEEE